MQQKLVYVYQLQEIESKNGNENWHLIEEFSTLSAALKEFENVHIPEKNIIALTEAVLDKDYNEISFRVLKSKRVD